MKLVIVLLMMCLPAVGQNTDASKYASHQVMLVQLNEEAVLPVMFVADGKQHLEFIPVNSLKAAVDKGGRPLVLADFLSALGAATEKITQLQAENEKLWKIAMKDAPRPETVVVQAPTQAGPTPEQIAAQERAEADARRQQTLQMWLQMQNANRPQNVNVNVSNCTRLPALCAGR